MIQVFKDNPELAVKYLVAKEYIAAYTKFAQGEGDKVYLPFDASNAMAAFANFGELFQHSKKES